MRRRRILYLFDAFNEMPEHLQHTAVAVLARFLAKHREGAGFLVVSRPTPLLDRLVTDPDRDVYEVLRLRPEQVRGFLVNLGLGALHERMPDELRDLAGNPFMLVAIARTLAGTSGSDLPRNRGRLYEQFVAGWMRREEGRRPCGYSFERVKQPRPGRSRHAA